MGLHISTFGEFTWLMVLLAHSFASDLLYFCEHVQCEWQSMLLPFGSCSENDTLLEHFTGDKSSTDWDKAWSSFRKRGKKSLFSQFNPNKYVSWNPRRSDYPLSEEVDPIKRTERSNLMLWTSPRFTLFGAIIVVSLLLIYTLLAPMK
ncbi:hypothetical protein Sjap_013366 [Stephania japonica]|uniref:Uncharacterized protein n=1 Tax=Stephania japonica TaxID=461633 RepID=A0AAP0IXV7_9MAGN